uniref:RIIa domain-containing protein n=1 Tax=Anopheles maculatus TaxID=74869 RepID=A0A182T0L1_9DIPT
MPISAPKIPEGLPELMRGLAKSVIKENPENLYVHAAEYFENLIRERDGHLEQGYQTFNAYQVYADYKEKTREKLGLTKDPSLSDGIGGDGDESGSGGSESNMRGRKRRRARKPSSREKENPATMVGNPSVSDEGEPQKLKSVSEDSGPPVPVVEQEIVKVHYNPPEAVPSPVRVVSAQSVEAEQAVSSILDDGQILDSDGTGERETGDELVDNRDDIGTAPSTAEITEQSRVEDVDAEPDAEVTLQDMETCFMHANVDDLLEKHTEDSGTVVDEGEDIPEGPQPRVEPTNDVGEANQQPEIEKEAMDSEENQLPETSVEKLELDSEIIPSSTIPGGNVIDTVVDVIDKSESEDQLEAEPTNKTDEIVGSINEQAEEETLNVQPDPEKDNATDDDVLQDSTDLPQVEQAKLSEEKDTADVVSVDTKEDVEEKKEDPIDSAKATNLSESDKNAAVDEEQQPSETTSNEVETENATENASAEATEDSPVITSRMGFEEDESGAARNDENENVVTDTVETNDDPEEKESGKSDESNKAQIGDESTVDTVGNIVESSQNETDQINDDKPAENDVPSDDAPSESTGVVTDEKDAAIKEMQENISKEESDVADDKGGEDPKAVVEEVHDGAAEPSGSVVAAEGTGGDLITEANAPTIPAEPIADDLNANPQSAEDNTAKLNESVTTNDPDDVTAKENENPKQDSDEAKEEANSEATEPETLATDANPTFENVVIDEMQKLLQDEVNDKESVNDEAGSSDGDKDAVGDSAVEKASSNVDEKEAGSTTPSASAEEQKDAAEILPSAASVEVSSEKSEHGELPINESEVIANQPISDSETVKSKAETSAPPSDPSAWEKEQPKHDESLEEVIEEPCVKREISPSKSVRLEKDDSTEKQQVEELEEIKKVDLSQLSKDSAEALFYTLKKSELENQEPNDDGEEKATAGTELQVQATEDDDDRDVVVKEEPPATPDEERTKRSFTNDFLDETPITDAPTTATMPSDGVDQPAGQDRSSLEADEQKDEFNPMVMVSMRSKQFQEQMHSRGPGENIDEELGNVDAPKRPIMRR